MHKLLLLSIFILGLVLVFIPTPEVGASSGAPTIEIRQKSNGDLIIRADDDKEILYLQYHIIADYPEFYSGDAITQLPINPRGVCSEFAYGAESIYPMISVPFTGDYGPEYMGNDFLITVNTHFMSQGEIDATLLSKSQRFVFDISNEPRPILVCSLAQDLDDNITFKYLVIE